MTFRARLLLGFLAAVLIPVIVLAFVIRIEMTARLTAQYERGVESLIGVIEDDLGQESTRVGTSLAALCSAVVDDNEFRRAAVDGVPDARPYLLDYAGRAMRLAGLSMLQIQDASGRIISSGHFRNEYDRLEPALPRLLAAAPRGTALVTARAPAAPFVALARVDSFSMAGRRFTVVGGVRVGRRFLARLARGGETTVDLVYPGGVLASRADSTAAPGEAANASAETVVRGLDVPFIDPASGRSTTATFRVTRDLAELRALRASVDRWFLAAASGAVVLAVVLVGWLASRASRPLRELAEKTERIDLDRLDVDFATGRRDEIGTLARMLDAMTDRLRGSVLHVKDAERRAALGELARQVNHDIKNGLTPIRNVLRHLSEVSAGDPRELQEIFRERVGTLDSSIAYLENLASNYARLSPRLSPRGENQRCDVNEVVRRVVADRQGAGGASFDTGLGAGVLVAGDPLAFRRIVENLVDNAVDSLESRPGTVTISTEVRDAGSERPRVRVEVADTGVGMREEELAQIFEDFYTTKERGTGLGLSIVRRLVMDLGGSIRAESEPGRGSRFVMEFPGPEGTSGEDA